MAAPDRVYLPPLPDGDTRGAFPLGSPQPEAEAREPAKRNVAIQVLALVLAVAAVFRWQLSSILAIPALQAWTTIFVSVFLQATPFLVFGVVLSAVIAVFVPASFFARALPRHPALAVPVASVAGVVLPGCECGSVPIAGALVRRGVTPAAALAFLLASPAINPIVLAATSVAFPGRPMMVVARAVASMLTACVMGWLWLRLGKAEWIKLPHRPELDGMSKWAAFWAAARHDVMHAGGYLVVGAMAAATINVVVPQQWMRTLGSDPVIRAVCRSLIHRYLASARYRACSRRWCWASSRTRIPKSQARASGRLES